jgi:hypothetical protein
MFKVIDVTKTDMLMAIVKPLKQFAEEYIDDVGVRNEFLDFCEHSKIRSSLVIDVTSFEDYWKRYKRVHP